MKMLLAWCALLAACDTTRYSPAPDCGPPASSACGAADCGTCARACAVDEECVSAGTSVARFGGFEANCLKKCTSQSDCARDERCASQYQGTSGFHCMSEVMPSLCAGNSFDPTWHCDFPPSECRDATTLERRFSEPKNQTCGTELVACANGCDNGACK